MTTIRDVAARAGVSVGLVSSVLNNSAPVSPALRRRVLQAVDDLGYVPHAVARSLKLGRTGTIGLVMPDITNPHFAALACIIEAACDEAGFMLTLCSTSDDHPKELRQLRLMQRQRVDGLVFIPGGPSEVDAALLNAAITAPAVMLDRTIAGLHADAVLLDNHQAAHILTAHLIAQGHTRIGLVAGRPDIRISRHREAGYRTALAAHGLAVDATLIGYGQFQEDGAHRAALALLDLPSPPTALVSTSNHTTVGIMRALAERHLACPAGISLVAIDDLPWSTGFAPRLTVAAQPFEAMGRTASTWLLDRILGRYRGAPRSSVHQPRLVVRGSVSHPPLAGAPGADAPGG
ncbi:LacI family DNA-binding transcriptional regulator [Lichenicoccus sp.]|uniref:LacI family DNA-binding transcriptional regulator n=1 Tax=Lichenicoccus sp. TaxID=2781899 RepID=UPI003D0E7E50